jgi:hypothetical protein
MMITGSASSSYRQHRGRNVVYTYVGIFLILNIVSTLASSSIFSSTSSLRPPSQQQQQQQQQAQPEKSTNTVDDHNHNKNRRRLVVGGGPAPVGKYPGIVWSGNQGDDDGIGWGCGGAMIHADIFITAAHCVDAFEFAGGAFVGPTLLDGSDGTFYRLSGKMVAHPNHRPPMNDVMLVHLKHANIDKPFFLNRDPTFPLVGSAIDVVGFGLTSEDGVLSPVLKQAESKVMDFPTCYETFWKDRRQKLYDDKHLCIGTMKGGRDACDSDSGTPQLVGNTVVSITNDGIGCGRPGVPAYNARISAFADWIDDMICQMSDHPPAHCLVDPFATSGTATVTISTAAPSVLTSFDGNDTNTDTNHDDNDIINKTTSTNTAEFDNDIDNTTNTDTTDVSNSPPADDTDESDDTFNSDHPHPATKTKVHCQSMEGTTSTMDQQVSLSFLGLGMVLSFVAGAAGMWMATNHRKRRRYNNRSGHYLKVPDGSSICSPIKAGVHSLGNNYGGIMSSSTDSDYDDDGTAMTEQSPALSTFSSKY